MHTSISLTGVIFSDGTHVPLEPTSCVLIVGPNNSGKSASLRAIESKMRNRNEPAVCIREIALRTHGTSEQLATDLVEKAFRGRGSDHDPLYRIGGGEIHRSQLQNWFTTGALEGVRNLAGFYSVRLDVAKRLEAVNPVHNIPIGDEAPSHPFHQLADDRALTQRMSRYFQEAFGIGLVLDTLAGRDIHVHVGLEPPFASPDEFLSRDYRAQIRRLPRLETQGDGMKSFLGTLLYTLLTEYPILLVDEPEAFLHPPQARLLGRMFAREVLGRRQLFIATHSTDFINGLLSEASEHVVVVRLNRSAADSAKVLDSRAIAEMWSDPLLKFSNALDGLFYQKVVICEADSDCKFYSAVLEAITPTNVYRPDIHFTYTGGKDRVHVLVSALYRAGIPVRVVFDFDVLDNELPLRRAFEGLGGGWSEIASHFTQVKTAIENNRPLYRTEEVKKEVQNILDGVTAERFPEAAADKIKDILRQSSPWRIAKQTGRAGLPGGQTVNHYNALTAALEAKGIFIVPVGEAERFCPSAAGHGPSWVANVFRGRNLSSDPELEQARQFVQHIVA
jgi:hypothetical protein